MNQSDNETDSKPVNEETNLEPDCSETKSKNILFKILVPSIAVGAIIGKGGDAIGQLQKETAAKIKLSKADDFYPGTTDRVCLIQGTLEGITTIHDYMIDRIYERPDNAPVFPDSVTNLLFNSLNQHNNLQAPTSNSTKMNEDLISSTVCNENIASDLYMYGSENANASIWHSKVTFPWERHRQVKILVPNCTAGLVIGKKGNYVAEIKRASNAYIQVSQNSTDVNLIERSITIAGDPSEIKVASRMVLAKIAEDPQSSSCPQISYSNFDGPIASAHPVGSPFALPNHATSPQSPMAKYSIEDMNSMLMASIVGNANSSAIPFAQPIFFHPQQMPVQYINTSNENPCGQPLRQTSWPPQLQTNFPAVIPNVDYMTSLTSPNAYNQYVSFMPTTAPNMAQATPTLMNQQRSAQTFISPTSQNNMLSYYMNPVYLMNDDGLYQQNYDEIGNINTYSEMPQNDPVGINQGFNKPIVADKPEKSVQQVLPTIVGKPNDQAMYNIYSQMNNLQISPEQPYYNGTNLQSLYYGDSIRFNYLYNPNIRPNIRHFPPHKGTAVKSISKSQHEALQNSKKDSSNLLWDAETVSKVSNDRDLTNNESKN